MPHAPHIHRQRGQVHSQGRKRVAAAHHSHSADGRQRAQRRRNCLRSASLLLPTPCPKGLAQGVYGGQHALSCSYSLRQVSLTTPMHSLSLLAISDKDMHMDAPPASGPFVAARFLLQGQVSVDNTDSKFQAPFIDVC